MKAEEYHPVDVQVGSRMRLRRKQLGISQTQLAETVGIAFQQVQKYERGANRVSASMLWGISQTLSVPISYFFEHAEEVSPQEGREIGQAQVNLLRSKEGLEMVNAFSRIRDETSRGLILDLVRRLATA